jgi:WD40 repeat protein
MPYRTLLGICFVLAAAQAAPAGGPASPGPGVDRLGAPLPPGAIARFGDSRLRHGTVSRLDFSPDGKLLAASTSAGVRVWDLKSGRPVRYARLDNAGKVRLTFAPDGTHVLSHATSCRLIDPKTGKVRARLENGGHSSQAVAVSPDGKTAAVGWGKGGVTLHDLTATGKGRGRKLSEEAVGQFAFSADGSLLAGAAGKAALLWTTAEGKLLRRYPVAVPGGDAEAVAVCFSPCGRKLAVSRGLDVTLWPTDSAAKVPGFTPPEGWFVTVRFSADGKALTGVSLGGDVVRWSAETGKEQLRFHRQPLAERGEVFALCPQGKEFALQSKSGAVEVWAVETGQEGTALEQSLPIRHLRFVKPGVVAAVRNGGSVCLWDVRDGRPLRTYQVRGAVKSSYWHGLLSPDGKLLVGRDFLEGHYVLHDVASGKELRRFRDSDGYSYSLAFSPAARRLVSVTRDGLRLWDLATGKPLRTLKPPRGASAVALAPDGRTAASSDTGWVTITELASGKSRQGVKGPGFRDRESGAVNICYARDGRTLAVFAPNHVFVVSLERGQMTFHQHEPDYGNTLWPFGALSPDGRWLAHANSVSPKAMVRDLEGPRPNVEYRTLEGHADTVTDVQFSPDGKYLVSASEDGTALVWDVRAFTGKAKRVPLDAEGVRARWAALADADAVKAGRAMADLEKVPALAVPLLKEKLRPVPAPPPQADIQRFVEDLNSPAFAVRSKAMQALQGLRELAEPALRAALARKPSLEVTRRLRTLIEKLEGPETDPERLRALRAVEVLERIGTPAARQVLKTLAAGAPGATLTAEARASLERLSPRTPAGGK